MTVSSSRTHQHGLEHGEEIVLPCFGVREEHQHSLNDNVLRQSCEDRGRVTCVKKTTQVGQDGCWGGGLGGLRLGRR